MVFFVFFSLCCFLCCFTLCMSQQYQALIMQQPQFQKCCFFAYCCFPLNVVASVSVILKLWSVVFCWTFLCSCCSFWKKHQVLRLVVCFFSLWINFHVVAPRHGSQTQLNTHLNLTIRLCIALSWKFPGTSIVSPFCFHPCSIQKVFQS